MGKDQPEKDIYVGDSNPFITDKRKCTDILCCVLFIVFWIGMVVIAGLGFSKGQPERLIFGTDWQGRTCGTKGTTVNPKTSLDVEYDFTKAKYLFYPRLSEDLYEMQKESALGNTVISLDELFGICVETCPTPLNANGDQLWAHAYYDVTAHPDPINTVSQISPDDVENVDAGSPWLVPLNTTDVMYRCLDLTLFNVTAMVRCIDPCEDNTADHCKDYPENKFKECGEMTCEAFAAKEWPKCRVTETKEIVDKKGAAKSNGPLFDQMNSSWRLISRWIGDIQKAAVPILICGGLLAVVLGFIWLILMKYCAGFFVWLTIFLVLLMFAVGTLYLAYRGELFDPAVLTDTLGSTVQDLEKYVSPEETATAADHVRYWAIAAYIFMVFDAIVLLILCFMCSRIKIAIGIIREASKSVQAMPLLIAFPLIPTALILCLLIYWVITAAYIATAGDITPHDISNTYNNSVSSSFSLNEFKHSDLTNYVLVYHLFGFLWTNQFFQAFGYITIAGAVAEYYWTLDKSSIRAMPIARSFHRTIRYHLGSLAFGSLIIAIVQAVRLGLEYIDHKTKEAQNSNQMVKVAMLCCKCCLWCFEQCLKFLNKNAYIMIAMKGTSFCSAMKDAFQLLLANAARVATVGVITTFLMMLGKLFIVAFSSMCMFLFINDPPKQLPTFFMGDLDEVDSPVFPLILTAVLAFAIATFFLGVYETAIDTILLCFCEDCKVNKDTGTYYMSDELLSYVDGAAKKNAFRHYKDMGNKANNIQENDTQV